MGFSGGGGFFFHQDIWAVFAWLEAGLTDVLTSPYFFVTSCNKGRLGNCDMLQHHNYLSPGAEQKTDVPQ